MKSMRKIAAVFLVTVMVLSLTACGGAESTVVLRGDTTEEMGGIPTTDTWTLTAKGDIVQTLTEVVEVDLSEYDDETRDYFISLVGSAMLESAEGIDGVVCTERTDGTTYIVELTIDCSSADTVQKAVDAGLIVMEGNSSMISLKQTQSGLESQGYEVVE